VIQKSMSLKYEPASEPLHISDPSTLNPMPKPSRRGGRFRGDLISGPGVMFYQQIN